MKLNELNLESDQDGGAYLAEILEEPATTGDQITVSIPSFDPDQSWGPCAWSPRIESGTTSPTIRLPAVGDRALVMFDEDDNPWIVEWWPYD